MKLQNNTAYNSERQNQGIKFGRLIHRVTYRNKKGEKNCYGDY